MNTQNPCLQVKQAVENGAQLIDVRSPEEFNNGALKGAINVPFQEIANYAKSLNTLKPILIYCVSGMRAQMAQKTLMATGNTAVFNIGGYANYRHCN